MTYKIREEQLDKLKQAIKDETKRELLEELEKRKVRLDSSDLDIILNHVKANIDFKLDSREIVGDLLNHIVEDEEKKRIDFYRNEVFSKKVRTDFIKRVLDQIPIPKDGEQGPQGEKGEKGESGVNYTLTDEDKQYIASLVDPSKKIQDIQKQLATVVKDIKTGNLKQPNAGIDAKELLAEINKVGPLFDFIDFTDTTERTIPDNPGVMNYNPTDYTVDVNTGLGPVIQIGKEFLYLVHNGSGEEMCNGCVVYPIGVSGDRVSVSKANADTHEKILGAVAITTMVIPAGGIGFVTDQGIIRGLDTSMFSSEEILWVAAGDGNDGKYTNTRPAFPNYAVQLGVVNKIDDTNGEITVKVAGQPVDTTVNFWNGVFRESFDFLVTSNGTTATGALSPSNGHPNMTMIFSDGFSTLVTTPDATITLTPGTDSTPQENFIYIPITTKVLTLSTYGWPTSEHIKVATVVLRSAATTQTDGALKNHNWNDEIQNTTTNQGHLPHLGERIRQLDAKWDSGVFASVSGTPDNIYVATTSGIVYQMHKQTFPAQSMPTSDIHIINHPSTPYVTVTNLNTQTVDASNVTLVNRSYSIVVWGVQNKTGEMSHLMCNLPIGSYTRLAPQDAVNDAMNYSVYAIPKIFQGTGFLIARFTFQLDAGGTQFTLYSTEDLRGFVPNSTAGSGGGGGGVTEWTGLSDTPATLTAYGVPRVNATGTGIDFTTLFKSGATQAGAGAVAGEIWRTSGHATLPDNVLLVGV